MKFSLERESGGFDGDLVQRESVWWWLWWRGGAGGE